MTRYDNAVSEVRSVLNEHMIEYRFASEVDAAAVAVVERLVAKGIIQSTDSDDLRSTYRTGPLAPGHTVVGGDHAQPTEE